MRGIVYERCGPRVLLCVVSILLLACAGSPGAQRASDVPLWPDKFQQALRQVEGVSPADADCLVEAWEDFGAEAVAEALVDGEDSRRGFSDADFAPGATDLLRGAAGRCGVSAEALIEAFDLET